jgi:RNA polymerase sigma factor (sigma-70 family)
VTGTIPPFHRFLEEHRAPVYRFLAASIGPQEADDVFQETFLAALRAYPKLRHAGNLRGWVLAIATRKAIDASRARGRRATPVADVEEVLEDHRLAERFAVRFDGRGDLPDDRLWTAVAGLPERQRAALVQRVLLDRSYPELATAMGISTDAARANVYQALKKLRGGWTDDGDD